MGIGRYLNHRVSIVRQVVTLDDADEPLLDEYGQPTRSEQTLASDVPAGIQPKKATERAAISQAGVAESDHTVYLFPQALTTADAIVHDPDTCPVVVDLPAGTYQVTTVPDAAGAGHHLEVSAKLTGSVQAAYAVPVGAGS